MTTNGGATVEFRGVSKRYADHTAVDDLSFTVPAGRICVLGGRGGVGDGAALRRLGRGAGQAVGVLRRVGVGGVGEEPALLRLSSRYVVQLVGLFAHHTMAENIAPVPPLLGGPAARSAARVDELLALIGLDQKVGRRYPAQLSGGERQRVGVARALAAEPPVLLMDEPFGAVDPIVRERLQLEFLRLHRVQRTTVLFVTHDIDEAIMLGDRIAVMRAGRLVQYAPPGELLAKPADEFVAQFVGTDRGLKLLGLLTVGGADVDASVDRASLPPKAPVLVASTTLRDALGQILTNASECAAVVDADGRYIGALSLEQISAMLRQGYRP